MKKIEKTINKLLKTNPFYANFFLASHIKYDTKNPNFTASASYCPKTGGSILSFGSSFIETLSTDELAGLVEHEILHLLFEHPLVFQDKTSNYNLEIVNIAMDASINQYIKVLPAGGVTLAALEKALGEPLEPFQTWEYYYARLLKKAESMAQKFSSIDEHGDGGDLSSGKNPVRVDMIKSLLKAQIDGAIKASTPGTVPAHILNVYNSLSKVASLPWQQLLSMFIAQNVNTLTRYSRKKSHRRFGLNSPGKLKKRELVLGVCVDSSGSVSDNLYEQFLSEIARLSTLTQKTYLIDADCEVQNVQVITKRNKIKFERHGGGGTAYGPAIQKALDLRCDAIIYFGDFDCADTPNDPKKPFLWVGINNNTPKPGNFGKEVRLSCD